nr:hypothetical protein [Tanacetum cinerariifolium]
MIIRLSMALGNGNKKSVDNAAFEPSLDAHLQIAPHHNPFFNLKLLNWNLDDVIVILSDDDEPRTEEDIYTSVNTQ